MPGYSLAAHHSGPRPPQARTHSPSQPTGYAHLKLIPYHTHFLLFASTKGLSGLAQYPYSYIIVSLYIRFLLLSSCFVTTRTIQCIMYDHLYYHLENTIIEHHRNTIFYFARVIKARTESIEDSYPGSVP